MIAVKEYNIHIRSEPWDYPFYPFPLLFPFLPFMHWNLLGICSLCDNPEGSKF